jgi:hypothetical protein
MQIEHRQRLILLWLLLSALLAAFLFIASEMVLKENIEEHMKRHLLMTLDESHFGNAQNRSNDREALKRIGQQINGAMQAMVGDHWYSAHKDCVVRLQRIDDVVIDDGHARESIVFGVLRNQTEREVVVGMSCSENGWAAAAICGFLGVFFIAITVFFPPPLLKVHQRWINYLLGQGYSGQQAFDIVSRYDASQLVLSPSQLRCLERLHEGEKHNFSWVLSVVTDDRVAALTENEVDWLLVKLKSESDNLSDALVLATRGDSIVIDLNEMELTVRGLPVPVSRTPLFYYAWYALSRAAGDGWITNPASNRPDLAVGQELAKLMDRYGGHAKAINDLEQAGLKARTLDQNRSKVKDDIVAVLGETLAQPYLFDASKHPDGARMRYRLHMEPDQIHIVTSSRE